MTAGTEGTDSLVANEVITATDGQNEARIRIQHYPNLVAWSAEPNAGEPDEGEALAFIANLQKDCEHSGRYFFAMQRRKGPGGHVVDRIVSRESRTGERRKSNSGPPQGALERRTGQDRRVRRRVS